MELHTPATSQVSNEELSGVNASRLLWMEWRQELPNWIVGPSRRFTGIARGRSWKLFNFSSANAGVSQSDRLMQIL